LKEIIFSEENKSKEISGIHVDNSEECKKKYTRTLEFLIGYLCVKELKALSTSIGVQIKDSPEGGDFNCISNFQNSLFHFEIKSGHLKNIDVADIEHFIKRHDFLNPEASIFFIDHQGNIDDYIKKILTSKLAKTKYLRRIVKIEDKNRILYAIFPNILIVNLYKNGNILDNFKFAMRFLNAYNSYIKRFASGIYKPEHLGYNGEILTIDKLD